MRSTLGAWCLVARVWGAVQIVAGLGVATAVWLFPGAPVPIPGRGGIEAVIWPLAPVLVAAALPSAATAAARCLELTASRSLQAIKGVFVLWVLLACCAASLVAARLGTVVACRNCAMLIGVALASTALLRPTVAWAPVIILAILTWILGPRGGGNVAQWAVLLHPRGSTPAAVAAACSLTAGCLLFCVPRRFWWSDRAD